MQKTPDWAPNTDCNEIASGFPGTKDINGTTEFGRYRGWPMSTLGPEGEFSPLFPPSCGPLSGMDRCKMTSMNRFIHK